MLHARQVNGDDPDEKGYPGPPGWGFCVGLTTPHSKKLTVTKVEQRNKLEVLYDRPKPTAGCSANRRKRRSNVLMKKTDRLGLLAVLQFHITLL